MTIDIKFPNPSNFSGNLSVYFDQLELCVYHARKAYEKIVEDIPSDNLRDVSIYYVHPDMRHADMAVKLIEDADKKDGTDRDEVFFDSIGELEMNISL